VETGCPSPIRRISSHFPGGRASVSANESDKAIFATTYPEKRSQKLLDRLRSPLIESHPIVRMGDGCALWSFVARWTQASRRLRLLYEF
jgi:hypothetical protein